MSWPKTAAGCVALLVYTACAARPAGPVIPELRLDGVSKIRHVVWIMQENRSFDNLFAGYPGADTRATGEDSQGRTIKLAPISFTAGYDLDHTSTSFFRDCNGTGKIPGTDCRMNGWNQEQLYCYRPCPPHAQYGYVPHFQTRRYFEMAQQYVLADRMFASNIDLSYVSHQYMVAGQANHAVDFPSRGWGCISGPDVISTITAQRTYGPYSPVCQDYTTLGSRG